MGIDRHRFRPCKKPEDMLRRTHGWSFRLVAELVSEARRGSVFGLLFCPRSQHAGILSDLSTERFAAPLTRSSIVSSSNPTKGIYQHNKRGDYLSGKGGIYLSAIVIGEVSVDVRTIMVAGAGERGPGANDDLPLKDVPLPIMANNGRPYRSLENVDWAGCFKFLKNRGAEVGADALIEVFCGKGVSSFWYPPSTGSIPMMGPSGQVVGSDSYTTPGGVGLTGWKITALAVKWK